MTDFHAGRDIRLDTSDTHKYGEILLHSEEGEICTVYPIGGDEDSPNYPLCHLIAAAPELYEALDAVMHEIETCLSDEVEFFGTRKPFDQARAALAKARGE